MTHSILPFGNRLRAAFTLVELLLVVAIIGVLASLALAVVAGAQDEARRSATVARLGQIRAMMLERLEGYEFRRVPVRLKDFGVGVGLGEKGRPELQRVRNRIIADMISVEMPRTGPDGPQSVQRSFPSTRLRFWLQETLGLNAPSLIEALEEQSSMLVVQVEQIESELDHASEGLAFVLATTDVDGTSGIDALGSKAFIDVDGVDGLVSVVDSWNDQISFEFNLTDENGDLYLDGNDPRDLLEIIGDTDVYDIPIQNIVVAFKTVNPL